MSTTLILAMAAGAAVMTASGMLAGWALRGFQVAALEAELDQVVEGALKLEDEVANLRAAIHNTAWLAGDRSGPPNAHHHLYRGDETAPLHAVRDDTEPQHRASRFEETAVISVPAGLYPRPEMPGRHARGGS